MKPTTPDNIVLDIQQTGRKDSPIVSDILSDAAQWLESINKPLWKLDELSPEKIENDINEGTYFLAFFNGDPAGTLKYQHKDDIMWPEARPGEAAYIHRLTVRRRYAGGKLSTAMMNWAVNRARSDGYKYLRLDCVIDRHRLRAVYENFGFIHHSDHVAGPYHVARYEYNIDNNFFDKNPIP